MHYTMCARRQHVHGLAIAESEEPKAASQQVFGTPVVTATFHKTDFGSERWRYGMTTFQYVPSSFFPSVWYVVPQYRS